MNEIALWLGYGVMVVGGAILVLIGLLMVWYAAWGAAIGMTRSIRVIRATRNARNSKQHGEKAQ